MKKKTEEAKPQENCTAEKKEPRHPAEMEADRLSIELSLERTKVEALSRRCILLGEELDAAIVAEERRTEQDMFDHINGNCYHKKAVTIENKRRNAHSKKMSAFYCKILKKNACYLSVELLIILIATLFSLCGIIHPVLAVIFSTVSLIAFGWTLNNCVYLLGRCGQ